MNGEITRYRRAARAARNSCAWAEGSTARGGWRSRRLDQDAGDHVKFEIALGGIERSRARSMSATVHVRLRSARPAQDPGTLSAACWQATGRRPRPLPLGESSASDNRITQHLPVAGSKPSACPWTYASGREIAFQAFRRQLSPRWLVSVMNSLLPGQGAGLDRREISSRNFSERSSCPRALISTARAYHEAPSRFARPWRRSARPAAPSAVRRIRCPLEAAHRSLRRQASDGYPASAGAASPQRAPDREHLSSPPATYAESHGVLRDAEETARGPS